MKQIHKPSYTIEPCRELNVPYAIQQKRQNKEKTLDIVNESKVKIRPTQYNASL